MKKTIFVIEDADLAAKIAKLIAKFQNANPDSSPSAATEDDGGDVNDDAGGN